MPGIALHERTARLEDGRICLCLRLLPASVQLPMAIIIRPPICLLASDMLDLRQGGESPRRAVSTSVML
jgi:hypothetical protein